MPARTRSSNKDTNYKVYYSKKPSKQQYFPHRSKTVRRPESSGNVAEKKQIMFLKDKMKREVRDSDEEDEEDLDVDMEVLEELTRGKDGDDEEGGVMLEPEQMAGKAKEMSKEMLGRGKKRSRASMLDGSEEDEEPKSKRGRKTTAPKRRRASKDAEPESEADHEQSVPNVASVQEGEQDKNRRRQRQSTMTQMIDGRTPTPGSKDPEFKSVKRSSRTRSSGKGSSKNRGKDKQQRTLTQMVPGLGSFGIVSDEDMDELEDLEAEERESQAYNEAVAKIFAEQGLLQPEDGLGLVPRGTEQAIVEHLAEHEIQAPIGHGIREALRPAQTADAVDAEDEEDEYHPTQNLESQPTKVKRTPRRVSGRREPDPTKLETAIPAVTRRAKPRFSLLSTPEKRRIREIPSSQSPPDSPLSTQVSPQKFERMPLKEGTGNAPRALDTPSKRKQVTFQEPPKEPQPPSRLRKFASVIQDSEDEDEDDMVDDNVENGGVDVGPETQALIRGIDETLVGAETQAMLQQIDRACANAEEDAAWVNREPSEELGELPGRRYEDGSQELGPPHEAPMVKEEVEDPEPQHEYGSAHPGVKREPSEELKSPTHHRDGLSRELGDKMIARRSEEGVDGLAIPPSQYRSAHLGIKKEQSQGANTTDLPVPSSPPSHQTPLPAASPTRFAAIEPPIPQPPLTPPGKHTEPGSNVSTPMIIDDDSPDEEEPAPTPTPPHRSTLPPQQPSSPTRTPHALRIQVPRSPSYSSAAAQQLHSEFTSYTQYLRHAPPSSMYAPPPSSMYAAPDNGFSYQATPFPPRVPQNQQQFQHSNHISQATTVDPTQMSPSPRNTPRKARSQPVISANTTPHKIPNSQPFVSPAKPPPLVIPSSFPSPGKAAWSSPVVGRTQGGVGVSQWGGTASIEDFSIPAPPPMLEESEEDEGEDEEL